ncbi:unnamed protein product [Chondrus crispus]|uniref:Uncharacterized protein n=1 Tax=Chondrus crispus TaxID=2769 RepID=R7Q7K0_CHOCR|nr:unnamed protein product [Chondrus crispus]CDF33818.1 unnamed protein product [Chondrus crispus]|eukprot:XP_005713637.1 unnamed protein product [Chondrus crispus]
MPRLCGQSCWAFQKSEGLKKCHINDRRFQIAFRKKPQTLV